MNEYNSDQVLAMVGSIGVLITALGAVIVNIIVAMKTGKKVDESIKNQQVLSGQIAEVHTITNSNLSAVKAELKQATMQIEEMKTFVRNLTGERDKLAAITATAAGRVPHSREDKFPEQKVSETLDSIDKNTEETAINTKKTEADVKTLKERK